MSFLFSSWTTVLGFKSCDLSQLATASASGFGGAGLYGLLLLLLGALLGLHLRLHLHLRLLLGHGLLAQSLDVFLDRDSMFLCLGGQLHLDLLDLLGCGLFAVGAEGYGNGNGARRRRALMGLELWRGFLFSHAEGGRRTVSERGPGPVYDRVGKQMGDGRRTKDPASSG